MNNDVFCDTCNELTANTCPACGKYRLAARPSVPAQGQAGLQEAVQALLNHIRCENPVKIPLPNPEGYREKNRIDDCGNCCYCKLVAALAASRSEAQPPKGLVEEHFHECAKAELLEDYDSDHKFNVSLSWVAWKMARFAKKHGHVTIDRAGAPAAGSAEREDRNG